MSGWLTLILELEPGDRALIHNGLAAIEDSEYGKKRKAEIDSLKQRIDSAPDKSTYHALLVKAATSRAGSTKSTAKAKASAENGKKGGRPKRFWYVTGGSAQLLADSDVLSVSDDCNWIDGALCYAGSASKAIALAVAYDKNLIDRDNVSLPDGTTVVALA